MPPKFFIANISSKYECFGFAETAEEAERLALSEYHRVHKNLLAPAFKRFHDATNWYGGGVREAVLGEGWVN